MDKNNKNLEHFFQSKLQNFNKEENWNTPPEFVWDYAKASFPKRKKKNRKFLFFMLFIGGVLLLGSLLLLNLESIKTPNKANNTNQLAAKDNTIVKSETSNKPIKNIELTEGTTNNNNITVIENTSIKNKTNSNSLSKTNYLKNQSTKKSNQISISNLIKKNNDNELKEAISNNIESALNKYTPKSKSVGVPTILNLKQLRPLKLNKNILTIKNTPQIHNLNKKFWGWEYGISHMWFINNPLELEDDEEILDASIDINYKNLNFSISKRLSKKWSLTSGLQYTQLGADINFKFSSIYYSEFDRLNLRSGLKDFSSASVSLNEKGQGVDFNYKPGLNIKNGAQIELNIKQSMLIRVLEIPIGLFYHLNYRKFELVSGGGISLNAFYLRLNPTTISIYNNNTLINNPIPSDVVDYHEFNWNFNSSILLKYKITNSINISVFIKINPFEKYANRGGIGLNYRL